jgi:hypothetical protein
MLCGRGILYHSASIDRGVRYSPYPTHTFEQEIEAN